MNPAVYSILFLVAGIILVAVEVGVIPGFGVIGVAGLATMLYGSWLAWTSYGAIWGIASMGISTLVFLVGLRLFLKSRLSRSLVLEDRQTGEPSALVAQEAELVSRERLGSKVEAWNTSSRPAHVRERGSPMVSGEILGRRLDLLAARR